MKKGLIACMMTLLLMTHTVSAGIFGDFIDWVCGNGHGHVTVDNIEWHYTIKGGNATLEHMDNWTPAISQEASGAIIITATLDGYPVIAIGKHAFYECSSLTSITLPTSVTSIADGTFRRCFSLANIEIPTSTTSIGDSAFFNCSSLTSITIPAGVTSIDDSTFSGCSSLTSITIPTSVTSIGYDAFSDCSSLTSITIPASVTSIGSYAFRDCSSLTSVEIPASVTSIDESTFSGCSSLMSIEVAKGNTVYASSDGVLFNKTFNHVIVCPVKKVGAFTIPVSVTSIGNCAFKDCSSVTSITIPESVTSIGYDAFRGCSSVTSITIPASVTSIGNYAFKGCSSVTSITIPASVTSIGYDAFSDCSSLANIEVAEGNTVYASSNGALFNKAFTNMIICPKRKVGAFKIPVNVTSIDNHAFYQCSSLTDVEIPAGMTSIGHYAFRGCSSLTRIEIPASTTSIGESAFSNCSSLARIDVAEDNRNYASLDGVMFSKFRSQVLDSMIVCPAKKSGELTIPEGVRKIHAEAFLGCSHLTKVKIPASITSIGKYLEYRKRPKAPPIFSRCTSLTHIDVAEDNVTYASMDGVLFDKSLRRIMKCPEGKTGALTIPASATSLSDCSLHNCSNLTSLVFEGNAPIRVGDGLFGETFIRVSDGEFGETSPDLVIYYHEGTTGWTNPWHGIKTQMIKKD